MKIVNKYILASCVFCYFAGLYMIAAKAGIMRLISQYGLHRTFNEWPEDFPSFGLVSAFLVLYTIVFVIITIWIYKANERHAQATDKLQAEAAQIRDYASDLGLTISVYNRLTSQRQGIDKAQGQRMQLLQKQIMSLHPSVFNDPTSANCINRIVEEISDAVNVLKTAPEENLSTLSASLSNLIEDDIVEVKRLKTNSVTVR